MELTKEHFEQHLTNELKLSREHFESSLQEQLKLNKAYFEQHLATALRLNKENFEVYLAEQLKNFATKDDLLALEGRMGEKFVTKDDFEYLKSKINNIEISLTDLNEKVDRIDKRDLEDSHAFASTLVNHGRRIQRLEKIARLKV